MSWIHSSPLASNNNNNNKGWCSFPMRNPTTPPNRLRGWFSCTLIGQFGGGWLAERDTVGSIYYHNNPCYFKVLVNSTQRCSMYFCLQSRISFSRGRNITFRVLLSNNRPTDRPIDSQGSSVPSSWRSFQVGACSLHSAACVHSGRVIVDIICYYFMD